MLLLTANFLSVLALAYAAPEVNLGNTTLVGRDITQFKLDFFGGIPYAEPPLGNLRFSPPVLKTGLDVESFDASNFGKGCLQPLIDVSDLSEDCLTINIYRPTGTNSSSQLPILFWTYGGGDEIGQASMFNGSAIVAQSVARGTPLIYINYNYRLGPLGFPQGKEADERGALNLGIKDQLTALEWVQANIEAFGGDKTKVTLFGQSAGSIMTSVLFLNSSIEKLARAAIFESGFAGTPLIFNAERREVSWQNFVAAVPSCASLVMTGNTFDCLREANSTELLAGINGSIFPGLELLPFDPTIDGPGGVYPDIASHFLENGLFSRLPFIAGTNLDEGTMFALPSSNFTEDSIRMDIIANYSPPLVAESVLVSTVKTLLELYPDIPALGSPYNTGNETFGLPSGFKRLAAILGDIHFQAQQRTWLQTAAHAGVKTFGYLFTQPQPLSDPVLGVPHGAEIPFVYGDPPDTSAPALQLSKMMIDYWVSFATSLDPNDGLGLPRPQWPQYTDENQVLLQLNGLNTTVIPDDFRKEKIDFINLDPAVFHQRRSLTTPN